MSLKIKTNVRRLNVLIILTSTELWTKFLRLFKTEYLKYGVEFEAEKSEVVLYNRKCSVSDDIELRNPNIHPSDLIVYLDIPIGIQFIS